jgi:protein-S-isoprenylcysteine O-methyltransferase Ste14
MLTRLPPNRAEPEAACPRWSSGPGHSRPGCCRACGPGSSDPTLAWLRQVGPEQAIAPVLGLSAGRGNAPTQDHRSGPRRSLHPREMEAVDGFLKKWSRIWISARFGKSHDGRQGGDRPLIRRMAWARIAPMTTESTFRAIAIANVTLCLPIGLFFRIKSQSRGERLSRRDEGVLVLIGLRLCGVLAWALLATYLTNPAWVSWSSLAIPTSLRWAGAALGLLVVPPFLFWTFHSLGRNLTDTVVTRREHVLVTRGPYRWVRHPFYLVVLLWGLSLSLLIANWLLALLGIASVTMLVARTRVEEAKLSERFGDEYRAYTQRTGRFFPRLGRRLQDSR